MTNHEIMLQAYIEAIYFTETGEEGQPPATAQMTDLSKAQAYLQTRNFYWAVTEELCYLVKDWAQVGHDLWLTRNAHGTGFWDRPEIYGKAESVIYTAMAKAMGSVDVEFEPEGEKV